MSDSVKTFNLDAVKAEAELEPFRFTYKQRRYQLPHMKAIDAFHTFDMIEASGSEASALWKLMAASLGEEKVTQLREAGMPSFKFNALLEAWQKHSGIEPGESEASTDS